MHLPFEKCKKKAPHPPFNSGVPIYVKRGMHPAFAINASDAAPPPGSYDPKPIIGNRSHVLNWKKQEESKEFSATMGGKFLAKYVTQRDIMRSGRGPGTHEIKQWPELVLENNCSTLKRDTGFGVTSRLKNSRIKKSTTPGPGYTGKNHNPHFYLENNKFKPKSCLQTFEYDGLAPRFNKRSKNWSVACNRYNPKDRNCLENFLNKLTSRRGPYDLFTGPRNASTLHSYQTQPKTIDTKNWPMIFKSEFEKSYGGKNCYKGMWTECPRFTKKPTVRSMLEDISLCYKDPNSPGPGSYDPTSSQKLIKQLKYPFNNSVKNTRPLRFFEISPGPTTYNLNNGYKRVTGNGWTWIFKSKGQRSIGEKIQQYNSF